MILNTYRIFKPKPKEAGVFSMMISANSRNRVTAFWFKNDRLNLRLWDAKEFNQVIDLSVEFTCENMVQTLLIYNHHLN